MQAKKLLIVDDEILMARAVSRGLQRLGFETVMATSPTDPSGFDLVLTDWQPHGQNQVTRCRVAGVPVVVYTGCPEWVGDDVIVMEKGCTMQELATALEESYANFHHDPMCGLEGMLCPRCDQEKGIAKKRLAK